MSKWLRLIVLTTVAIAALGAPGCASGTKTAPTPTSSPTPSASTSQSPAAKTPTTKTTAAPSPEATDDLGELLRDPDLAAQALYDSWREGDEAKALRHATQAAVDAVFRTPYNAPGWSFEGCDNRDAGYDCHYMYEGGSVLMRVEGGASAGYHVESVAFTAD